MLHSNTILAVILALMAIGLMFIGHVMRGIDYQVMQFGSSALIGVGLTQYGYAFNDDFATYESGIVLGSMQIAVVIVFLQGHKFRFKTPVPA